MNPIRLAIATATIAPVAWAAGQSLTPQEYPTFEPGPELKNGYSAEDLRGATVKGANAETLGSVEDVIISGAQLERLVVAVNEGLFGTGGRRLAVDWDDVQAERRDDFTIEHLSVDVQEGNLEPTGVFKDGREVLRGAAPDEWRASELIGDDVDLEGSADNGYVSDIIFEKDGEIGAIAATTGFEHGILSFYTTHHDEGWEPGDDHYVVPYSEEELMELLPDDALEQARTN